MPLPMTKLVTASCLLSKVTICPSPFWEKNADAIVRELAAAQRNFRMKKSNGR
jgi:hypothetical protein